MKTIPKSANFVSINYLIIARTNSKIVQKSKLYVMLEQRKK